MQLKLAKDLKFIVDLISLLMLLCLASLLAGWSFLVGFLFIVALLTKFQAIVIDLSSLENTEGAYLAGIDLDHGEEWYFLYFDEDNYLIHENVEIGSGQSGDGVAFPIEYDTGVGEPDIAKIVIYSTMNNNVAGRTGYALDNIVLNCVDDMETAWGAGTGFGGSSWATYIEVDRP